MTLKFIWGFNIHIWFPPLHSILNDIFEPHIFCVEKKTIFYLSNGQGGQFYHAMDDTTESEMTMMMLRRRVGIV